jgi:hypothetical protein
MNVRKKVTLTLLGGVSVTFLQPSHSHGTLAVLAGTGAASAADYHPARG